MPLDPAELALLEEIRDDCKENSRLLAATREGLAAVDARTRAHDEAQKQRWEQAQKDTAEIRREITSNARKVGGTTGAGAGGAVAVLWSILKDTVTGN